MPTPNDASAGSGQNAGESTTPGIAHPGPKEGSFPNPQKNLGPDGSSGKAASLSRATSLRRTPLSRFASVGRRAGKLSLVGGALQQKTKDKTDTRRTILGKPSRDRTESDILSLMEILGPLRFAKTLRHAERVEVCRSMGYRTARGEDVVFNQGDPGNTFYIILSGSVSVAIKGGGGGDAGDAKHTPTDHFAKVATLYNGDSFGELALLQEGSVRSATVRAETDVEFLTISRDDYNRILGAVSEEQLAAKIKFLHGLPAFAGVPASMIRSTAYVLTTREYTRNAVVYKQGEETEEIFFVESGGVKFVREILNQTALRKMNVLRDGPVAAAAIALHDKGGFDATPPPPPGVDDTENETIDEFSHLHGTRSLASSLRGESRGSSRARTPNAFPGLAGDRLCEFETIGGHASEAAATFNENERRGVENNDANTNTTPTASGPKFANGVPTLGDTPLTGDTVGHDGGSCQPTLGMRRTEFGTEFNAKSFGGGSFGGFKTSAAFGVDESTVSAKHRGLGRLFLEAGRAGALDYFGDVVLTKKLTQPASAITTEPTKCFVLNKWDMLKRVDRDVVRRFRSSKSRAMKFYADEPAILAEFQRAMTWDRYKKSLVLEVVTDKSERQKGGR